MPTDGFGNLIALPLQRRPRAAGHSLFVDDEFRPYDDQWAFLSTIQRVTRDRVTTLVGDAVATGQILGVRLPLTEDDDAPWAAVLATCLIRPVGRTDVPGPVTARRGWGGGRNGCGLSRRTTGSCGFRWVLLRCLKVIRLGWPAASVLPLLRGMRALTVIQCGARNTPRLKIFRQ